jgi:hypothetical protein
MPEFVSNGISFLKFNFIVWNILAEQKKNNIYTKLLDRLRGLL